MPVRQAQDMPVRQAQDMLDLPPILRDMGGDDRRFAFVDLKLVALDRDSGGAMAWVVTA